MRISTAFSIFLLWAVFATPAGAADWQVVASAGQEKVEIDLSRIMRNGPGRSVAWTRLALGRELADHGVRYDTVQAMNRYDCEKRTLVTLRRIYLKGMIPVRDEKIAAPAEIAVGRNGADGLLLDEACTPRTVSEAYATAATAGSVASAASATATAVAGGAPAQPGKPGVMHADVRTAGEEPSQQTITVADGDRPNSAAETRIEIRPSSERPRFIGLPKLEKPAPKEPESAQAESDSAKAAETKPADASSTQQPAKSAAKPAPTATTAKTAPAATTDPTLSRHEREKQLATSGPRRYVPRPRPKAKPEAASTERHDIHWSYEGAGAPENWAKLKPEYGLCATGKRQSPIDIRDGIGVDLEPVKADYLTSYFDIVNNGHSIQVNVGEGSVITVMGRTYELVQFHFHRPAEERINGKIYPMGIHLVHRDPEGKLAVIAVLLEDGAENPLIQTLWNNLPLELNQNLTPDIAIDLLALLPANRDYYTYMGSLTTPPCTEDVLWLVFKQPLSISAEQVAIFSRLYRNNARPIQPSYSRLIKENR